MVYLAKAMAKANEQLAPSGDLDDDLVERLREVSTVLDAAAVLDLASVVPEQYQEDLVGFLANLPPSVDAAIVAAARSALERGVPVTFTWQPGVGPGEVRVWDVSTGRDEPGGPLGMVNIHLVAPDPEAPTGPG